METKKVQKISLNQSYAVNNYQFAYKPLESLPKINQIGDKCVQHRFKSNTKIQQQFDQWYLNKNTKFQHPRRRKFYKNHVHRGQYSTENLLEMPYFTDDCHFMDRISKETWQFMLKSSTAVTMWNIEVC